jgi:hypothetical protein
MIYFAGIWTHLKATLEVVIGAPSPCPANPWMLPCTTLRAKTYRHWRICGRDGGSMSEVVFELSTAPPAAGRGKASCGRLNAVLGACGRGCGCICACVS